MTRTPTNDEMHNKVPKPSASGLDSRCLTGRALCISKRTNSLVWVVDGKPQLRMDVRFGSAELPTREGSFSVGWKSRNHVSTIYHTPMPYAMFFSGGQAVHYSPDFAARGYNGASHGCVNVRNLAGIQCAVRPGPRRRQGDRLPLTAWTLPLPPLACARSSEFPAVCPRMGWTCRQKLRDGARAFEVAQLLVTCPRVAWTRRRRFGARPA